MSYQEYWNEVYRQSGKMNDLITSYWHEYSHLGTWQFWVVVIMLVGPLVLLYFTVDRTKIFHLFFFGYTVHILWAYTDIFLQRYTYFIHTFFIAPVFPYALSMTASALPVGFLLLYQYCLNTNKNFYFYSVILSTVFALIFAPLEHAMGFVEIRKGLNFFHLFLIDLVIAYAAYFFTALIRKLENQRQKES
ncbi:hypothetical protein M3181_16835 [Mesobacillus maritimus]|uniref:hypothetical protein n=1 Tax=Mesobacillus maritimus TaxID=1643336 RepID=UPI0020419E8F|nr:hypothetical protein [Mesobacillus maritimus]MCM3670631.1 hypothetical protein [Mesobacillus maritimus]